MKKINEVLKKFLVSFVFVFKESLVLVCVRRTSVYPSGAALVSRTSLDEPAESAAAHPQCFAPCSLRVQYSTSVVAFVLIYSLETSAKILPSCPHKHSKSEKRV